MTRADTLAGAAPFDAMSVDCHTAPGVGRAEFAQGLYPLPPKLFGIDTVWAPNELFWIVTHGITMTGMPAFGPTHNDKAIWSIVAFTSYVDELSYYDYSDCQKYFPLAEAPVQSSSLPCHPRASGDPF
ncbi:MAG: hypothetical protein GF341_07365 [candidate division Zixibacteria bacterium]|nr:hypothetical protein [candidate division Zixibacteria bacterium]